ncbi:MAG: hypothetical protein KIT84_08310 [Labilithrix sp.]|nr:hypothetical protein [Labilithrix sp.]MCW5811000.1 hypothetical protein [Labilithrix sp.]
MPLSEAAFTELVDGGCAACKSRRVVVESYVAQTLPLMGGEVYGSPSWGYKGEDLVRGTFRIACKDCDHERFTSTACPRCDAAGALDRVLETENSYPLAVSCTGCGSELLTATAYVPATVTYEGKRAEKARTQTAPEDPGFHAFKFECKSCRHQAARTTPCPLCGGDAPAA